MLSSRIAIVGRLSGFTFLAVSLLILAASAPAQNVDEATRRADEALSGKPVEAKADPLAAAPVPATPEIDLLHMASPEVGGVFMYPIYGFSFVVVLFVVERCLALRRKRIIPTELVEGFGNLAGS